jgi:hypothetical protein
MLHDWPWHNYTNVIAIQKPPPEKNLGISFIPVPGDNVIEVEPVIISGLQPPREEMFVKSQSITLWSTGFDAL